MNMTDLCNRILNLYGTDIQLVISMEEMAELTKEISKSIRGNDNRDSLVSEIVDVLFMMEQLKVLYKVEDWEIEEGFYNRAKRMERRMERDANQM